MDTLKNWKIGDINIVTTKENYGECRKGHIAIDMPTHKSAAIVYRHEIDEDDVLCFQKAKLIAASPDLLVACNFALQGIRNGQIDELTIRILEDAIAKAKA